MKGIRIRIHNGSNSLKYEHESARDFSPNNNTQADSAKANQTYWKIGNGYGRNTRLGCFFFEIIAIEPDTKDTAEVILKGKLNSKMSKELNDALEWALSDTVQTVILNLSEVSFITRRAISTLITTNSKLAKRNATLLLTNLQPQILKVLKIFNALPGTPVFRSPKEMDDYLAVMQTEEK